jgi:hypothetical protein
MPSTGEVRSLSSVATHVSDLGSANSVGGVNALTFHLRLLQFGKFSFDLLEDIGVGVSPEG